MSEAPENWDVVQEEMSRYSDEDLQQWSGRVNELNREQLSHFRRVMHDIQQKTPACYFLKGRPGRGKTFLSNILVATARQNHKVVTVCSPTAKGALN